MALTLLFAWTLQTRILAQGDGKYQKKTQSWQQRPQLGGPKDGCERNGTPNTCYALRHASEPVLTDYASAMIPLPSSATWRQSYLCSWWSDIYIYMYIICNYIWKFLRDDKADGHTAKGPLFLRTDDLLQIPSRYWLGSRISSHQKSMRLSLAVSGSATLGTVTEADHNLLVASRMDTIYGSTLVFPKLIVDTLWPAGILTWTWYDSMLR